MLGKDYTTPDLYAKVTGQAKYAEDFRVDGMLFCKLLLSPVPHGRVKRLDVSKAMAMPGVKAILTQNDLPAPADSVTDLGVVIKANPQGEKALTNEPLYQGEPVLAVAAIDEFTAAEAIEAIDIEFEHLPFAIDPLDTLRPGGPNPRVEGNIWIKPPVPAAKPGEKPPSPPLPKRENSSGPTPILPKPDKAVCRWASRRMNGATVTWTQVFATPLWYSTKRL